MDLIRDEAGDVVGVTALEMETGDVHIFEAKTTLLANRWRGTYFAASTNAFINTGDGLGMAARAGDYWKIWNFWQFHPTGVHGGGRVVNGGCRGRGAILRNSNGERFMERYAPARTKTWHRVTMSHVVWIRDQEDRGCGPTRTTSTWT